MKSQYNGQLVSKISMGVRYKQSERKQKPSISMASYEDACGVRHWIIPECDCEYYIEAYVTHLLVKEQIRTA